MNPDRMVIKEAMRTFTYLNLYGYLTDAVVVNRVFPPEAAEGYFAGWRENQQEQMELVRSAFSPVPILTAPYFDQEVVGPAMLDRLADEAFEELDPGAVLHDDLSPGADLGERVGDAAAAAAVRGQGRHPPEEDRPGGGRPRRRPEADDHAAARRWPPTGRAARASRTARCR